MPELARSQVECGRLGLGAGKPGHDSGGRNIHRQAILRSRWLIIPLLLLTAVLTLVITDPTYADPAAVARAKQEEAALRDQVKQLNNQVEIAVEHFDKASDDLRKLDATIQGNRAKLTAAEQNLQTATMRLDQRLVNIYKAGGGQVLDTLLGARSLSDLVNRISLLRLVAAQDSRLLGEVKSYRDQVALRARQLEAERAQQREQLAQTEQARAAVEARLGERQQSLRGKEKEVAQLEKEEAARQAQLAAQAAAARAAQAAAARRAAAARGLSPASGSFSGSGGSGVALRLATSYLGVPYVWGGESPAGFDCSGLVQYVYARAGIDLPRVASDQQNMGASVSRDALRPGDLVFFGYPAHHVGIYAGNGTMIDAPYTGAVVRYDSVDWPDYSGARRVG